MSIEMSKIQKYSLHLDDYHTLLIREEDYMHRRPCGIVTHRYNKIVALYNKDKDFAKAFLVNTKIKLAYIISGNIKVISDLLEQEVMEVSEDTMVHNFARENDGDIRMKEIYTEILIGEAIQREHAQMILDKI